MKTVYFADNTSSHVIFDEETKKISNLDTEREAISRIFKAPEDMKLVYTKIDGSTIERDVKKDQIIILFYEGYFDNKVIVVESEDWVANLVKYNEKMEEQRKLRCNEYDICTDCEKCCCDSL